MSNKFKNFITALYISFIIPIVITYVLSAIQVAVLGCNQGYYKKTILDMSNVIVTLISIVLIISTYFIKASSFPKIIFYVIGMVVSFIEILFPFTENNAVTPVRTLRCILIIGYMLFIILSILHSQKKKEV